MALDFYRLDTNDFLFGVTDTQFGYLDEILEIFTQWTGLVIDQYNSMVLTVENQEALVRVIEKYTDTTDLNKDKKRTSAILEFKGLIGFFLNNKVDLRLVGD